MNGAPWTWETPVEVRNGTGPPKITCHWEIVPAGFNISLMSLVNKPLEMSSIVTVIDPFPNIGIQPILDYKSPVPMYELE